MAPGLQSRRLGLLIRVLVSGLLVAACSGPPPQDPAPNAPATRQSGALNQGNTPGQNALPSTTNTGPANAPATSQGGTSGQAALPGTEEFGLTKEGLRFIMEVVTVTI